MIEGQKAVGADSHGCGPQTPVRGARRWCRLGERWMMTGPGYIQALYQITVLALGRVIPYGFSSHYELTKPLKYGFQIFGVPEMCRL